MKSRQREVREHMIFKENLQPVNGLAMGKLVDEFVNDTVDADCSADQLKLRVIGVLENEVVPVEVAEAFTADAASHLKDI